ncbi:hypothetical protein [Amycolatopsis tucumanensis]|uniref:Uncharacterized protein n=1 Tax=Amycolatopsis tucumanensis TaxID=401106 RepID=A0ABP7JG54_9PSEU|nr:hypothetical protein [Amycolatopsis tucumanensis]
MARLRGPVWRAAAVAVVCAGLPVFTVAGSDRRSRDAAVIKLSTAQRFKVYEQELVVHDPARVRTLDDENADDVRSFWIYVPLLAGLAGAPAAGRAGVRDLRRRRRNRTGRRAPHRNPADSPEGTSQLLYQVAPRVRPVSKNSLRDGEPCGGIRQQRC